MDLSVNKSAKSFLRSEFEAWYAAEVMKQQEEIDEDGDGENFVPVDVSTARMKSIGAQWLVRLFEHLAMSPNIINNGFLKSGIPQSIGSGVPYLAEVCDDGNDEESTDDEFEDYEHYEGDEYYEDDEYFEQED